MQQVSLEHHFGFDLTAATRWESLGQYSVNPSNRYCLWTKLDLKGYLKELQLGAIFPATVYTPNTTCWNWTAWNSHRCFRTMRSCALGAWHTKTSTGVYFKYGKSIYSTSRSLQDSGLAHSVCWWEHSLASPCREWNASYEHPFLVKV